MRRAPAAPFVAATVALALGAGGCFKRKKGPAYDTARVAVGAAHACALAKDGALWCWGDGARGQLFDGATASRALPARVRPPGAALADVVAGGATTCTRAKDGAIACAGALAKDGLGAAAEVALGDTIACARGQDADKGAVRCWTATSAPRAVAGITDATAIAAGGRRACALVTEGTLRCWTDADDARVAPAPMPTIYGAVAVGVGARHACVVRADRTLACWGENDHGELGDGTTTARASPTTVAGIEAVHDVSIGDGFTCAHLYDGTVRCWGRNDHGVLTDGTLEGRAAPQMISGMFHLLQVAVGGGTVCALLDDGTLRCWGENGAGQVGDGSHDDRGVPVTVRW